MGIKFIKPKIVKPKIRITYKCGMCKRQVAYNKPHKCIKRKAR